MSITIRLKKGFDIPIKGIADKTIAGEAEPKMFGVKPVDFPGLIPKLNVKPGDNVKAGTPLFHDKLNPEILFTSPVSGRVISVERGDRRKILEVVVEKTGNDYVDFGKADPAISHQGKDQGTSPGFRLMACHTAASLPYYCRAGRCSEVNFYIRIRYSTAGSGL